MFNPTEVGKRLKKIRSQKRMTLRDVATRAGVSATLISDIERGKTSPTINSLSKISNALDETIVAFIEDAKAKSISYNKLEDRVTVNYDKGSVRITSLTTGITNGKLDIIEAEYKPKTRSKKLLTHAGEKCAILLDGNVEIKIEENVYSLEPGDTLHFNSEIPHQVQNIGEKQAKVLWVMTPLSRNPVI